MSVKFGPAGNAESFYANGGKKTVDNIDVIADLGLDAYEYQCGNGVRTGEDAAKVIADRAAKRGISLSVHSPYFISLSSVEEEKRDGSIKYILDSVRLVKWLGGDRVVVHSGSCAKLTREQALEYAKMTVTKALKTLDECGYDDVHLCLETMGKINQLGTLDEVIELCKLDERLLPTVDFGHLNARILGGVNYAEILDKLENGLGRYRAENFHAHFSKIEYSTGGEKRHLTFVDNVYGPDFEPLMELLFKRNLSPTIICESAGTQTEDALAMKSYYKSLK